MPNSTSNSGIRDNHRRGAVADFLKARIQPGARLSIVSAYFTIYAYDALKGRDPSHHLAKRPPLRATISISSPGS